MSYRGLKSQYANLMTSTRESFIIQKRLCADY